MKLWIYQDSKIVLDLYGPLKINIILNTEISSTSQFRLVISIGVPWILPPEYCLLFLNTWIGNFCMFCSDCSSYSQRQMGGWMDLRLIQSILMSPMSPQNKLPMMTGKKGDDKKSCHSTLRLKTMFKTKGISLLICVVTLHQPVQLFSK